MIQILKQSQLKEGEEEEWGKNTLPHKKKKDKMKMGKQDRVAAHYEGKEYCRERDEGEEI